MTDYTVEQAKDWVEQYLHEAGWPRVSYGFLVKLAAHVGPAPVEYFDCEIVAHAPSRSVRPQSTVTIVVFTANHVVMQTVDWVWTSRTFRENLTVLRRSSLRSLTSAAVEDATVPALARFCDTLERWSPWLSRKAHQFFQTWVELLDVPELYYQDEPDPGVMVDLTYGDLADRVLTLPLTDDPDSAERLARFLPSLTQNLS